jgi:hypothetical protein
MASTKVIATTWAKKDLLAKLKATLKRMDDEVAAWEKDSATLDARREAWEKKASAWAKKNMLKSNDFDVSTGYNKGVRIAFYFKTEDFEAAVGKRPEGLCQPSHKVGRENSDYEQVRNAIALVEGSIDTEFKINTTSGWAQYIR